MKGTLILSLLAFIGFSCGMAWAGDEKGKNAFEMDFKAKDFKVSKAINGPAVSANDFKNRVVLVALWDANNPGCIASLAHLADLQKQYAEQGLVIIAAEMKGASAADIKKIGTDKGAKVTLVSGCDLPGADNIQNLPHAIVFDHTGKCVFRGSLAAVGPELHEAIAAAPIPALAGMEFHKLGDLAAAMKKGETAGSVIKRAKIQSYSADTETADEAKYIVDQLTAYGKKEVEQAKALADTDLLNGLQELRKLATAWQGTDIGNSAVEILDGLKKEQAALGLLSKVHELASRLTVKDPAGKDLDPASITFKSLNNSLLSQLRVVIREITKQFGSTKAAAEATNIASRYHIDISEHNNLDSNGMWNPNNGYPYGGYPYGGYPTGGGGGKK